MRRRRGPPHRPRILPCLPRRRCRQKAERATVARRLCWQRRESLLLPLKSLPRKRVKSNNIKHSGKSPRRLVGDVEKSIISCTFVTSKLVVPPTVVCGGIFGNQPTCFAAAKEGKVTQPSRRGGISVLLLSFSASAEICRSHRIHVAMPGTCPSRTTAGHKSNTQTIFTAVEFTPRAKAHDSALR